MSDCHYLPLISAFHDGELPDERAGDVEAHLAHCADCRSELRSLRSLSSNFADIELPKLAVSSRLRMRQQASVFAVAGRVRFVRTMTAVAASIFIVAGGMLAFQQIRSTPDQRSPTPTPVVVHPQIPDGDKISKPATWDQPGRSANGDTGR